MQYCSSSLSVITIEQNWIIISGIIITSSRSSSSSSSSSSHKAIIHLSHYISKPQYVSI